jgi:hypothetical protein
LSRHRKRDPLAGVNLLELAPARAAEWREAGERAVLLRPPPGGAGWRRLPEWLSFQLSTRRIRLDEVGTFVWRRLDGRSAVRQVAAELRARFGEQVEPAEERVGKLIRLLHRERLVTYPGFEAPSGGPPVAMDGQGGTIPHGWSPLTGRGVESWRERPPDETPSLIRENDRAGACSAGRESLRRAELRRSMEPNGQ